MSPQRGRRLRALLVTTDFPPLRGGIQTYLHELVRRTSCEMTVVAPADPGYAACDAALEANVQRVASFGGTGRRGFAPALAVATLRSARRFQPDVVLAGHVLAGFGGVWTRTFQHIPLVVGTYGVELISPGVKKAARFVLPRSDAAFAVSQFTADAARALGARAVEVIPTGAPTPAQSSPDQIEALRARFGLHKNRVLLTVARLEPHKGIDVMIRALVSLPDDVRYLVVGSGPHRARLEHQAAVAGVADRVVFAGALTDDELAAAYRTADLFALASRSLDGGRGGVEGCPVSLLEAAAYGLPIVAGATGGVADAVEHGVTGLLIDPEAKGAAAEAVTRLLGTPLGAELAGRAARMAAERTWGRVAERVDSLLERTLDVFGR